MTLQQMEYIVAVDKYRHFIKAAEACGVTQSTLSSMIQKLERELDIQIFDRNVHPVTPTLVGERVIRQAKVTLFNAFQIQEMVEQERKLEEGKVSLGVIPTVAPYVLPKLFREIHHAYPKMELHVTEARTANLVKSLKQAELDIALLATPLGDDELLEIPVYYEKFVAYVSPEEQLFNQKEIEVKDLPSNHLWVLQEGHCLRNQVMNICHHKSGYSAVYEAGSIDTLVKIVDENGGYTIIPELHVGLLRQEQKLKTRPIVNPQPVREISLVVRYDYVRERMLNIVSECIRKIIPEHMIDERLKKFAIKI
jgi:LysR family hydrogen peroxide-inducible transcriptional activator